MAADVLRAHPYADVVVHSEGEVPFADIVEACVDAWLEWRPERLAAEADNETLQAFVAHLYDQKQIPARFYQQCGALEFA